MKKLMCAAVAALATGAAAGEAAATPRNLVKNGTFKTREGWAGGAFDKGPGRVVLDQGVGRLEKDRGPGATQLLQVCEIGKRQDAPRLQGQPLPDRGDAPHDRRRGREAVSGIRLWYNTRHEVAACRMTIPY